MADAPGSPLFNKGLQISGSEATADAGAGTLGPVSWSAALRLALLQAGVSSNVECSNERNT